VGGSGGSRAVPGSNTRKAIPGKHSINSLQQTTVLETSHIIRKVLQCETLSLSGGGTSWFNSSTRKKRLVTGDNNNVDDNNNNNNNNKLHNCQAELDVVNVTALCFPSDRDYICIPQENGLKKNHTA
jgi:hypothetical protein